MNRKILVFQPIFSFIILEKTSFFSPWKTMKTKKRSMNGLAFVVITNIKMKRRKTLQDIAESFGRRATFVKKRKKAFKMYIARSTLKSKRRRRRREGQEFVLLSNCYRQWQNVLSLVIFSLPTFLVNRRKIHNMNTQLSLTHRNTQKKSELTM